MELCDLTECITHEILYVNSTCPACDLQYEFDGMEGKKEDFENEKNDLQDQVSDLEQMNNDLVNEKADLERQLEEAEK